MPLRLDEHLVTLGLAPDAKTAAGLVLAGRVRVNGGVVTQAGAAVKPGARIEVEAKAHPFVSRGGVKLEAALEAFGIDVTGMVGLDIGASTGGFTHCLLLRGAARVHTVDVNYGQLAWELRQDPRVVVHERTNIRAMTLADLGGLVDLAVMDLSFISLGKVVAVAAGFLRPGGQVVALVKPQFEASPEDVAAGGLVVEEAVREGVLAKVREAVAQAGLEVLGVMVSPLVGKKSGNVEYLLHARKPGAL